MKLKYEFINDLTSDVAFRAYGKDYRELFTNSAIALSSVICKLDKVKPLKKYYIEAYGDSYEELLYNWLSEIIAAVDTEAMFFSRFNIIDINEKAIRADCMGEDISPSKGSTVVKAVTRHKFSVGEEKGRKVATVTLDV